MIEHCHCCRTNGFRRLVVYQGDSYPLIALCEDCEAGILQDLLHRETETERERRFDRVRQGTIGRIYAAGGLILEPEDTPREAI